MISAVLVTLNEAVHLKSCLAGIKNNVDEIIVVDLGSRDESINIAKSYQAKVFNHQRVDYVELVRNFAISKATGEWVLLLDPDERVSESLWDKLEEVAKENKYSAVNIPRKNIFFGKWIKHTNWWPDRHIRFFQKGKVSWLETIHSYPKVEGKVLQLPKDPNLAIIHSGYETLDQFIDRQNRYSEIEASQRFEQGERFSWWKFFWNPAREFLVRFIKNQGYLDGFYGFALTYQMCVYQLIVGVKLWEHQKKN